MTRPFVYLIIPPMTDALITESHRPLWNRNTRVVCSVVAILFALLSLLHLHGFSFGIWHYIIDGKPPTELIFGQMQGVRTDDFVAVIPQILSQAAHEPPFPVQNRLIGAGNCNMRINYAMPIRDWSTMFRRSSEATASTVRLN